MSPHSLVKAANEAFYRAFGGRDFAAMEGIWARRQDLSCIHPGWRILSDREAVLESWRRIMENPASPAVVARYPRVHLHGPTALVLCYEYLDDQVLCATNLFVMEDGQWRLTHHQASPCAQPPAAGDVSGTVQ